MAKKLSIEERDKRRKQFIDDVDHNRIDVYKAVKEIRIILGMSQKGFAEHLGISKVVVSELELGKRNPTVNTLNKIFVLFGLEVGIKRKK